MRLRTLNAVLGFVVLSVVLVSAGQAKVEPSPVPPAPAVAPIPPMEPEAPEFLGPQEFWSSPSESMATFGGGGSYLGIDIGEINSDRVQALKLKEERGVEVLAVDRDAPAGKSGIQVHDVIQQFNGTPVEGVEQLRRLIHEVPAGRTVMLGIVRNGSWVEQKVQLSDRTEAMRRFGSMRHPATPEVPETPEFPDIPAFPSVDVMVRMHSPLPGATVENLTPQLGEFFGVKNGEGILVRSVEKGSPAEQAGLRAGDVIVKVDGQSVVDRGDWKLALKHKSGKVAVGIVRDKKEQTITVTLPDTSKNQSYLVTPQDFDIQVPDIQVNFNEAQKQQLKQITQNSRMMAKNYTKMAEDYSKVIQEQIQEQMKDVEEQLQRVNQFQLFD